jgi:hypothetical protein
MSRGPRPAQGVAAGRCPVDSNGILRIWISRRGRLALVCDECDATWFDRTRVEEETVEWPEPGTFELADGDALERPATEDEIRSGGWGDLLNDDRVP